MISKSSRCSRDTLGFCPHDFDFSRQKATQARQKTSTAVAGIGDPGPPAPNPPAGGADPGYSKQQQRPYARCAHERPRYGNVATEAQRVDRRAAEMKHGRLKIGDFRFVVVQFLGRRRDAPPSTRTSSWMASSAEDCAGMHAACGTRRGKVLRPKDSASRFHRVGRRPAGDGAPALPTNSRASPL